MLNTVMLMLYTLATMVLTQSLERRETGKRRQALILLQFISLIIIGASGFVLIFV